MMSFIVPFLLFSTQSWAAHWELDQHRNMVLAVAHDGRKHVIQEGTGDSGSSKNRGVYGLSNVTFKGRTYVGKGGSIVDVMSGKALEVPRPPAPSGEGMYVPVFRARGGLALSDRMFWIFSWDSVDVSMEPPIQAFAYEIVLKNGTPSVARTAELPSLIGVNWSGFEVTVTGSSLAIVAGSRFVDFDLRSFQVQSTMRENVLFAPSGAIFRSDGQKLWKWLFAERDWKLVRNAQMGFLHLASTLGKEDLLCFGDGLMLAASGRTYRFPRMKDRDEPIQVTLYLDPKRGVGCGYTNRLQPGGKEVFLGTDLQPLCPIGPLKRHLVPLELRDARGTPHGGGGNTACSRYAESLGFALRLASAWTFRSVGRSYVECAKLASRFVFERASS